MKITDVMTTAFACRQGTREVVGRHPGHGAGAHCRDRDRLWHRRSGECAGPQSCHPHCRRCRTPALLIGQDPLRTEFLLHRMDEHVIHWFRTGNHAIAGIEMACWTSSQALGYQRFRPAGRPLPRCRGVHGLSLHRHTGTHAAKAKAYVERGFRTLKVKVGRSIDQDAASIAAIRDTVGPDVRIRIDANQGWSVPTAIKAIRAMEPYDLEYVEQPVTERDFDGMAQVARAVETPLPPTRVARPFLTRCNWRKSRRAACSSSMFRRPAGC